MYTNADVLYLKIYSQRFCKTCENVAVEVIDYPKFSTCWGGLTNQHHSFDGGLAKHTREVIDLAFSSIKVLELGGEMVDKTELFLACLFHDIGKTHDYVFSESGGMVADEHKRKIHHISRSAIIWSHAVTKFPEFSEKYHDSVLHAILSHHGQRQWGSPVAPKSRVSWILHLCDGLSARMNDCDTIDLVRQKEDQ